LGEEIVPKTAVNVMTLL